MRVLLTGASGFLGTYVLSQLTQRGIEVVVVGRTRPMGYRGTYIEADLLQIGCFAEIAQLSRASHLLHLAWNVEYGGFWASPMNLRWLEASLRLVEAFCAAHGQKVVVAGSCAEYKRSYGYCSETTTPLVPTSMYGVAKDATRRLISAVCSSYQVPLAWGRVFLPYGRGADPRRLIPSLIEVFEGKRLPFKVDTKVYRDFVHADDVASAFLLLLEANAEGAFNICSARPTQLSEVVRVIAEARNANPQMILDLSRKRSEGTPFLVGDNTALNTLGWSARFKDLKDGLNYYLSKEY
jgi:nucleoside-diphosphate-sugar epimerase